MPDLLPPAGVPVSPASCWPDHCFCEAPRTAPDAGPLLQPSNALSNLAFVGVALLVLARSRGGGDRLYALAVLLVGAASFAFHATLTFATQTADVLGMYLVVTWFVLAILARRFAWRSGRVAVLYVLANSVLLSGLVLVPELRRYVFAALVMCTVLLATPSERRALVPALLVLGASFVIWTLDLLRWWCTPDSLLQGHALWHIGSAVAAWLAWARFSAVAERRREM
ncbi:MAG: ceramidase [Gemmatimonadaceae bacterium]|nr:ceramidase [Gemmatimonadaceae bacterium]